MSSYTFGVYILSSSDCSQKEKQLSSKRCLSDPGLQGLNYALAAV